MMKSVFRYVFEISLTMTAVFVFTTLMLQLTGSSPLEVFYHIFKGSLGSWVKFAQVIAAWVPLTLCSCGLLYTFRIALWNIGVEGQIMMGAIFATAALRLGVENNAPEFFLGLSCLAGIIGGSLWAILAGVLKTKGGVNEIFAGLGLNFAAQGMILWLIFGPWKRPGIASMSGTELFPEELWLPCFSALKISPAGTGFAVLAVLLTAIMLHHTRIGLNLKAVGANPHAAYLFGLKPERYMLMAMIFAGGAAGLAGSIQVTGVYHRLLPSISSNYGYLSLLAVMLSNYRIYAAPAVAFFFACLNVGSIQLPMVLCLDSSLSGVIQGILVLATLGMQAWRRVRNEK